MKKRTSESEEERDCVRKRGSEIGRESEIESERKCESV